MSKFTIRAALAALLLCLASALACQGALAADMPQSIVIFPVGSSPGPAQGSMPPVAYNHEVHYKWMRSQGLQCAVCHHTGDQVACTACHKVDGGELADGVGLWRAMHSPNPRQPEAYKPSSCVGCHMRQLERRDCAGCHRTMVRPRREGAWCNVCHRPGPAIDGALLASGIEASLPARENARLAAGIVAARKPVQYVSPMTGPYKVLIDDLNGKEYGPCVFNHRHHVASMLDRIQDSRLAGAFHASPYTVCMACHHNSPPSATPPSCVSCHGKRINPARPGRPALKAAYHLLCMTCHADMQVARPRNTDCHTCHRKLIRSPDGAAAAVRPKRP